MHVCGLESKFQPDVLSKSNMNIITCTCTRLQVQCSRKLTVTGVVAVAFLFSIYLWMTDSVTTDHAGNDSTRTWYAWFTELCTCTVHFSFTLLLASRENMHD